MMKRIQPDFYGVAVFGTSDGLHWDGNGILTPEDAPASIFEFEDGRDRAGALHHDGGENWAYFRRHVMSNDEPYQLIGVLYPCCDAHQRSGFYGACVAIGVDAIRPEINILDWEPAIEEAVKLADRLGAYLNYKTRALEMPRRGTLIRRENDADAGLRLVPGQVQLHSSGRDYDLSFLLSRMQAVAFVGSLGSAQASTIILYSRPVRGSHDIVSPYVEDHAMQMEETIRKRQSLESRGADLTRKPVMQRHSRDADPEAECSVYSTVGMHLRISRLEKKITELEKYINSGDRTFSDQFGNEGRVPPLAHPFLRGFRRDLEIDQSEAEDFGFLRWLRRPLVWISGLFLVLLVIFVVAFFRSWV